MQALKLKLYQNLCNYRKEGSFGYVQTYPLPTPSVIRGMIHEVMDLNEYYSFKVSIQGQSDNITTGMQKVFKFDRAPNQRPDNPYKVTVGKSIKTATHGLLFIDLIVDMRATFHVVFEEENEKRIKELYDKIQDKQVILGRNEDIALVEEIKIVNVEKITERTAKTILPMYVASDVLIENSGIRYRLPFWYEKVESFEENRIFHFVEAYYIGKGVELKKDKVFKDEEGDIVSFLESPNA